MWQTPVIKPHEKPIPVMAAGSVPVNGGEALYRAAAENDHATFYAHRTGSHRRG
jgi:hypothetical protein